MFAALFSLWIGVAGASESTSTPPPPPPAVDLGSLPDSAVVQTKMPDGKNHPAKAHLLSDKATVAPGDTFRLGVYLIQQKGWHTYWKSPGGEIGLPTEIEWTLPKGTTAAQYEYPVPQRFDAQNIVSYGYDGQVLLFSEITIPSDMAPGAYDFTAKVNWLVCETSCIPGDAELTLPVEVAAEGVESTFAELFDHFEKQHPIDPLDADGFAVETALSSDGARPNEPFKVAFLLTPTSDQKLTAPTGRWPSFTHINTGWDWMVNDVTVKATEQGGLLVVMHNEGFEPESIPKDAKIGGLFQVQVGDKWIQTEIERPLPWAAASTPCVPSASPIWQLTDVKASELCGGDATAEVLPEPAPEPKPETAAVATPALPAAGVGLVSMLIGSFFGGLILNVMPCVLPVLTLKLYSLVEQRDIQASQQRTAGLAYTGGILVCFWFIAAAVVTMRSVLGEDVGWGFMFQSPTYVAVLTTVVFAFALSLFGVYEFPALGADQASRAGSKEGPMGFFFTGVFAVLVATPCTAPFMGSALAVAFAQPTPWLVASFTMLGLGLASPFLVIAFVPVLYKFLPRPGAWMETFKQFLGFTLLATSAWLLTVLAGLIGGSAAIDFTIFLLFVAVGCWVFGQLGGLGASGLRQVGALAVGVVIAVVGTPFVSLSYADDTCDDGAVLEATGLDYSHEVPWQPFTEERVAALSGETVFIDFTADWCWSCKVNERTVLESNSVRTTMAKHGVVPLKADWTRKDDVITKWLKRYGKVGVPFYLVLPADGGEAIPLPEVLTPGLVNDALNQAS
jgi:thiol:disulfide interchange protein